MRDELWDWLLGEAGQEALRQLADCTDEVRNSRIQVGSWKREQIEAVTEMLALRRRAAAKLEHPHLWWLTQRGLEQASGTKVARYKAETYFRRDNLERDVFDICSGVGGDLMEMARQGLVVSVDQDSRLIDLQRLTADALGLGSQIRFMNRPLDVKHVRSEALWHLDPDRRVGEKKSVQPLCFSPTLAEIDALVSQAPDGVVKLAPATVVPNHWNCRREWIGAQGECKQQLALFGCFAEARSNSNLNEPKLNDTEKQQAGAPGTEGSQDIYVRHRVTVVRNSGEWTTFEGSPIARPQFSKEMPEPGDCLYEPQAAVFAAGLVPALAQALGLQQVSSRCGYLVGEGGVETNGLASCFRIEAISSLDSRKLRKLFLSLDVGQLEIKKRGVPADWLSPLSKLKPSGVRPMTLLVFPYGKRVKVALATRISNTRTSNT